MIWTMYFDGASAQNSAGTGVVLISPSKENIHLSYKLDFKTMNNLVEYEALLLGLKATKDMGIMCMNIFGDTDLIIQQVTMLFRQKISDWRPIGTRYGNSETPLCFLNCHIFLGL